MGKFIFFFLHFVFAKKKEEKMFKYRFGPQPLAFESNWSLTFQLCQIGHCRWVLDRKC